ncbi:G1/s-specific cyclin-e1 [Plakobranchus ocellatus]|uniref:G1/s-specific cyclin-e1 n=1 Tax=Plakobranchus ocellatus TaxID=259542 RepID=A0AAV3ZM89_9GAST|nr:G1/s-specific cyclin-e1 [Plakobranchus ocellatus]
MDDSNNGLETPLKSLQLATGGTAGAGLGPCIASQMVDSTDGEKVMFYISDSECGDDEDADPFLLADVKEGECTDGECEYCAAFDDEDDDDDNCDEARSDDYDTNQRWGGMTKDHHSGYYGDIGQGLHACSGAEPPVYRPGARVLSLCDSGEEYGSNREMHEDHSAGHLEEDYFVEEDGTVSVVRLHTRKNLGALPERMSSHDGNSDDYDDEPSGENERLVEEDYYVEEDGSVSVVRLHYGRKRAINHHFVVSAKSPLLPTPSPQYDQPPKLCNIAANAAHAMGNHSFASHHEDQCSKSLGAAIPAQAIVLASPSGHDMVPSCSSRPQSHSGACGEQNLTSADSQIREALRLAMLQCGPAAQAPDGRNAAHHSANQWISSSLVPTSQEEQWEDNQQDEVDGTFLELPGRRRPVKVVPESTKMTGRSPPVENFKKFRSLDFQLRFENFFSTPPSSVSSPLPFFNWAESNDVWQNMLKKEQTFQRDPGMFKNHPELQPRMRSILLDWLSEVCEVYRLHKETFMLAVDFIDRYLSVTTNVPKTQLQLLGISSLFVAAKLEEIYPPKLSEFAYVTDSACTEQEIIKQEMIIVKALKWDLTPMTTNAWLSVYLQVANIDHIHDPALGFVFPQFSTHAFIQISRLCDLSVMDAGSLQFRYSVLAASALYHHTNQHVVKEVSGLNWADLYPCVRWMAPFAKAILEVGQSPMKFFPQISNEDAHNIQTHNVDMALLDRALTHQALMEERECLTTSSPLDLTSQLVCLLEPPGSSSQSTDRGYGSGSELSQEQNIFTAVTTRDEDDVVMETTGTCATTTISALPVTGAHCVEDSSVEAVGVSEQQHVRS